VRHGRHKAHGVQKRKGKQGELAEARFPRRTFVFCLWLGGRDAELKTRRACGQSRFFRLKRNGKFLRRPALSTITACLIITRAPNASAILGNEVAVVDERGCGQR